VRHGCEPQLRIHPASRHLPDVLDVPCGSVLIQANSQAKKFRRALLADIEKFKNEVSDDKKLALFEGIDTRMEK
jgi:hypothetical protein